MSTPTARQVSTARVKELIARQEDRFRQARPRSQKLWQEARELMPRGVPSSFQDAAPQPVFVERGRGSRVWDVDGNEYIDFHNGFGVMVVGHAHPKIVDAVSKRIALGSHFAQPVAEVVVVARELARRFGQPQWRFTNSGTESTLDAVRIARAFTGRQRLIKMEASYHGHHDALMVSVEPPPDLMGPPEEPASVPQSEGIPPAVVELTTVVPFNDLEALERAFTKHPDEVAAVIVEPAMMNVGIVLPDSGYLAGLRDTAHRHGALLIFDEVKTGATIAAGGATERFGVTPDLIALAKAIGGGLPCGAIGGRADVMEVIEEKRVAQMGTFNGNPLTMAASKVTLLEILDASAYSHFDALAETLQGGLDSVIGEYELPFHVITLAARGGVTYRSQRVRNYRDYLEIDKSNAYLAWLYQCNRGVLMAPGAEENWTLSVQHSVDDVQRYVDNFAEMARDLRS
ncbi:MAG: aspartate aminotransferase family protein [Actinobacteria bacterium 13_1_40CM_2_65_8]|nr:MAG: aspartate aminotransferase family protein [Actinobacteria bacterium 13_1_40CM_4_65_12]OLD48871.1 MAG: aspartate aminotransferase family protein [Actinobacteria bacterium 13_1_40CM_2_65_8]